REDECLTLDHWRMRAYALEANWSRCSHACAIEQTKREQAEARAEALAEALRDVSEEWAQCVGYNNFDELCAHSGSKTYLANAVEQALAAFDQDDETGTIKWNLMRQWYCQCGQIIGAAAKPEALREVPCPNCGVEAPQ